MQFRLCHSSIPILSSGILSRRVQASISNVTYAVAQGAGAQYRHNQIGAILAPNSLRRLSTLGYISPMQFEQNWFVAR